MGKFAKVFEIGEEQLLVMTRSCDETGNPQVACITEINGSTMTLAPTFEPKEDTLEAEEKAWVVADKYFDSFDQDKAEEVRRSMVKSFEELSS